MTLLILCLHSLDAYCNNNYKFVFLAQESSAEINSDPSREAVVTLKNTKLWEPMWVAIWKSITMTVGELLCYPLVSAPVWRSSVNYGTLSQQFPIFQWIFQITQNWFGMSDDKKSLSLKESWTMLLGKALKPGDFKYHLTCHALPVV